jgi:hypothetical protein
MSQKTIYCAECLEDIPNAEVQWEDDRLYCGRCGSELAADSEDRDLLDEISSRKPPRLYSIEDDEDEEEEDDEEEEFGDDESEGDIEEDEDEEEDEDDDLDDEKGSGNGRSKRQR